MRDVNLTAQQIVDLALGKHTLELKALPKKPPPIKRDFEDLLNGRGYQLRRLAEWVANNLVLLQEDCPECGQAAPEDCDWCEGCDQMQCKCVCEE